jgi:flagellar basal body-associated protein FliL
MKNKSILIIIIVLCLIVTTACITGTCILGDACEGDVMQPVHATETYGAQQLHIQLTELAKTPNP